jgi:6,7-dimethyl-8-ribityllumazine synthase
MQTLKGDLDASGLRIGIVVSRWNRDVTSSLVRGAERALIACGASMEDVVLVEVPGAFEIPTACRELAVAGFNVLIALGAVIKGETAHFEYVSNAAMHGIEQVSHEFGIPIGCGILTTYDLDQALARAGDDDENKGTESALAAIETAQLLARIRKLST